MDYYAYFLARKRALLLDTTNDAALAAEASLGVYVDLADLATGKTETYTLTITAEPTAAGNVTLTLNGVATVVAILDADVEDDVATKIATAFTANAFWTVTANLHVVTITAKAIGAKTLGTYSAGTTGATGTLTRTTVGKTIADTTKVYQTSDDDKYAYYNGTVWIVGDNTPSQISANIALKSDLLNLATAYDPAITYALGKFCTTNGLLYECTVAIIAPEVWTIAHWTVRTIGSILEGLV